VLVMIAVAPPWRGKNSVATHRPVPLVRLVLVPEFVAELVTFVVVVVACVLPPPPQPVSAKAALTAAMTASAFRECCAFTFRLPVGPRHVRYGP
jgi:hypothetical protein